MRLSLVLGFSLGGLVWADNVTTTVRVPTRRPDYAEYLNPHLASLSIELDNFPIWAGESLGSSNNYTHQIIENLGNRTGRGVWLRIGGNTEDRTRIDKSVPVWNATIPPATPGIPYHEANAVTVGRDFYSLANNLPASTKFTFGLNLRSMNLTETHAQAVHLAESFASLKRVQLEGVEIGNEVDGFQVTPYTNLSFTNWNPYNYTDTWKQFAENITDVLKIGVEGPGFQVGSFMSSGNTQSWNPLNVIGTGVLEGVKGIIWWSDHFYTGVWGMGGPPSPGSLMSKSTVRGVLSQRIVDIRTAKRSGLEYIVGETNSYANHGAPGISNTAEAAMWAVDYMLQAATLGVSRVHFHNGLGYRYNLFQPISNLDDSTNITQAHILPLYHAFLIVNEAIGLSGEAHVAELGTLEGNLAVYGVWEKDKLVKMVMVNSGLYQDGDRGILNVGLDGIAKGECIKVKRLKVPKTEAYSGLTWAGQSFETTDGVPQGKIVEETIQGSTITLQASEVVLVTIGG